MMCGGLKGCPTRIRSGCLDFDCITLGVIPDELDAMMESIGATSSIWANNLILKSGRSVRFPERSPLSNALFSYLSLTWGDRETRLSKGRCSSGPSTLHRYICGDWLRRLVRDRS